MAENNGLSRKFLRIEARLKEIKDLNQKASKAKNTALKKLNKR